MWNLGGGCLEHVGFQVIGDLTDKHGGKYWESNGNKRDIMGI
jgi:hypothetical protein